MSYCVNCGVELADSEKCCPLCQTEVINPRSAWKRPETMPYPQLIDRLIRKVDRRYVAALISTFALIPPVVTVLCDWMTGGGVSWSLYVVASRALFEIWFVVPLLAKRFYRLRFLALDSVALLAFLCAVERLSGGGWFLPLALPIVLGIAATVLFNAYLFRRGRGKRLLYRMMACLLGAAFITLLIEIFTDLYVRSAVYLNWSPFVVSPCVILAMALLILESQKRLKEEIHKRMFY